MARQGILSEAKLPKIKIKKKTQETSSYPPRAERHEGGGFGLCAARVC